MSTVIRPEVSKRNPYYINKHRYYELKHFCMQYPDWVHAVNAMDGIKVSSVRNDISNKSYAESLVEEVVIERDTLISKIHLIETVAQDAADDLSIYILKGVTEGLPFEVLQARYRIPCCKDTYYILYRKFFWLLDRTRK